MLHPIQLHIYKFLSDLGKKQYKIPEHLLNKFGEETKKALLKQFEREPREFHLSMSNVGRPSCQLLFEKEGVQGDANISTVRNLYGDLCEDIVLFLLHASGIKVVSELQRVAYTLSKDKINSQEDLVINGEYDVILDLGNGPSVWDIKSASDWAFKNKYTDISIEEFIKNDNFGYTTQLVLYSLATGTKLGGWIIIDKSSGEIGIIEIPPNKSGEIIREALYKIYRTVNLLSMSERPKLHSKDKNRNYNASPELFRGKATGKIVLQSACTMCQFKFRCWPSLTIKPQENSKAKNPRLMYYVDKEC